MGGEGRVGVGLGRWGEGVGVGGVTVQVRDVG